MAFRGTTAASSRIGLTQLALLFSSLIPVHSLPVEPRTRFVIHVPHTIAHVHHHHTEQIFYPVVHHKEHHHVEDNFKGWHHIVEEEETAHRGEMTHAALSDEGFSSTPEKSQEDLPNVEFATIPEKTEVDLEDSGYSVAPEKTQDEGLSLTPQKWSQVASVSHRNPFSGRHFGRSLGTRQPVQLAYKPSAVDTAAHSHFGVDTSVQQGGYETKEEVEDVTTPSPPGFKPQLVTNAQTQQQSSGLAGLQTQEILPQISSNLEYDPSLQLQYQASLQAQVLEPQANVDHQISPASVGYVSGQNPTQVMSYQLLNHLGNDFNTVTLHNKREVKHKLHAAVTEPMNKGHRIRVPVRIQRPALMASVRLPQHPGMHIKTAIRIPEGTRQDKVVKHQVLKNGEKVMSGYESMTSESKAVPQISTQDGRLMFKIGGKRMVPEKVLVRQKEPGRVSNGVTLGPKIQVPTAIKMVPNVGVAMKVPEVTMTGYKEAVRTVNEKVPESKLQAQKTLQAGRSASMPESKIKSEETARFTHLENSVGRKDTEMAPKGYGLSASVSKTASDLSSQANKAKKNPRETSSAHQGSLESKSVPQTAQEVQAAFKVESRKTDQQGVLASTDGSQVFYPSVGPFGNSDPKDIIPSTSSKLTKEKLHKKTSEITQNT